MNHEPVKSAYGTVRIGPDHWDVPVRMGMLEYLTFVRRLDAQLRRLVMQFSHGAPPAARESFRRGNGRRSTI